MKCLVTGGAGFIGSNLVDKLIDLNHEVVVIDNESAEQNDSFYWNKDASNYKYDICDYNKIDSLFKGIDCVFHLAAQSRIQPSIIDPEKTFKVNCNGTLNILKASVENGISKFIYSSTSSYYGLKNEIPFNEDMDRDCLNPYSYTKIFGEDLCKMYSKLYKLNVIIFRYFNVYGPRQPVKGEYAPVIGIFQKQWNAGEKITVIGDGMQTRDYTHVDDVVSANLLAMDKTINIFEIFNVGTGKKYSVLDLAKLIGGEIDFLPQRLGEARDTQADISKITKVLKWRPTVDLNDWIGDNQ
jgi:UDP-glucose 4-epimerase